MKRFHFLATLLLMALFFASCEWFHVTDDDDSSTPSTPTTPTQEQISFTFSTDVEVVEDVPYLHLRVFPSDKFTYYAWFVVPSSDIEDDKIIYVQNMLMDSVRLGATYQKWKSELIVCCNNLQYDLPLEGSTDYTVLAFMISPKLQLIGEVYYDTFTTPAVAKKVPEGFIDMGLINRTYWYSKTSGWNEYLTYQECLSEIPEKDKGARIPTQMDWFDLLNECKLEYDGYGLQVTSRIDKNVTLYLPFVGMYDENGTKKYDGEYGCFWTSTIREGKVQYIRIYDNGAYMMHEVDPNGKNRVSAIYVWYPPKNN